MYPGVAPAAGISIGPGAAIKADDGNLDLGCLDVAVSGLLELGASSLTFVDNFVISPGGTTEAGSANLQLAGDWVNRGAFVPGTATVQILDGCARSLSRMQGDTTFHNFRAITNSGKELQPEAAISQEFIDHLTLRGSDGARLRIRSSEPDVAAFFTLHPEGSQNIEWVNVRDNDASAGQRLAPGPPQLSNSIDSGNTLNWFQNVLEFEFVPIPTLSPLSSLLLAVLLLGALYRLSRNGTVLVSTGKCRR